MTIKVHEFQLLQDFKNDGVQRALKLSQYQTDAESARARLRELQTQYEYTFTESVKHGTDATAQLAKIDDEITLQKEVVVRRERDLMLAHRSMPEGTISTTDVVNEYQNVFVPKIIAEYEPIVDAKLKLARDLLLSCIIDHRNGDEAYRSLREEMVEMSKANRYQGKTDVIVGIAHPTGAANVMKSQGAIAGVREVINQVRLFTHGHKPNDFEYIAEVPKMIKGAK